MAFQLRGLINLTNFDLCFPGGRMPFNSGMSGDRDSQSQCPRIEVPQVADIFNANRNVQRHGFERGEL